MDQKDKTLLKELDIDARQSNTQLAKKIGLSKDAVSYRIKKLEKKGIIKGYYSIVDYYKLGFYLIKIPIKFASISEKGEDKVTEWLLKRKTILWAAKTEGHWDVIYTLQVKTLHELITSLEEFKVTFPTVISELQILIAQDFSFLNEKYLYGKKEENKIEKISINTKVIKTDKRDEKIIKILEENSRESFINIANKLNITPEAIIHRVKNLKKNEIIRRFKVRLNFEALELDYNHIYLSLKDYSKIDEITKYYKNSEFCTFIMRYQGNYHMHLEWVTKRGEFRKKVKELKEHFGDFIADYHTVNIFEEHKLL